MGDGLWVKVIISFRYCPGTAKVETSACSILYQVYPARQTCQLPLGKDSMTVCSDQELRDLVQGTLAVQLLTTQNMADPIQYMPWVSFEDSMSRGRSSISLIFSH